MNKLLAYFGVAVFTLFIAINLFGSFVGGIWLLLLGEWKLVVLSIVVSVIFPFIYGIVTLPALLLLPILKFAEKNAALKLFLVFLSQAFHSTITYLWTLLVLSTAFGYADATGDFILPYLLLAYAVSIGPFQYMAKHESDNKFTSLSLGIWTITFFLIVILVLLNLNIFVIPALILIILLHSAYASVVTKKLHDQEVVLQKEFENN